MLVLSSFSPLRAQLSLFSSFSLAPSPTRLAPAAEAARLEYSVEVMWLLICLLRPAFKITLIALCLRGESTRLEPEQVKTPPSWALTSFPAGPWDSGGPSSEEREPLGARGLIINWEILSLLQNKLNNFLFCWRSFAFGLKKKR
jgi:hypothetical protein